MIDSPISMVPVVRREYCVGSLGEGNTSTRENWIPLREAHLVK